MKFLQGITRYIVIIGLGILLAFFVAIQEYNSADLSASILSLTEQDFFESTSRDAGYKKENQTFEVFLSEKNKNEGFLTVSILYSPDVQIFINDITTNCEINILESDKNSGNILLSINGYENNDLSEGIFQIPYNGNLKDITLEYIKSETKDFSIGNLNNIEENNH